MRAAPLVFCLFLHAASALHESQNGVLPHSKPIRRSYAHRRSYDRRPESIDVDLYIERSTRLYRDTIAKRNLKIKTEYNGSLDAVVPWDVSKETYLWDLFPPSFNCPFKHRLGRLSDGGKVVCNWEALRMRCSSGTDNAIVYTVGVRDEVSFEVDLIANTGCTVHAFDHTISTVPAVPNMVFNAVGIAAKDDVNASLKTLPMLMQERNHSRIDLLKIDCEGCEWDVFADLAASNALDNIDQVVVELHLPNPNSNAAGPKSPVHDVFRYFESMESHNLYPFSREMNLFAGASREYPWVVEYAFVRPNSMFMKDANAWSVVARKETEH